MPTSVEVQQLLTGPGGAFEVVEEEVGGIPMRVYKHRMRSLREVAALGAARGDDQLYLVYGNRRIGFGEFAAGADAVSNRLAAGGVGPGDRVAVLSGNNPQWIYSFWGAVNLGAILVGLNGWWKADEVVYGLEDSGARVLVADRGRFARIAADMDRIGSLEAVYLIDADPEEFGGGGRLHGFEELLDPAEAASPATDIDEDDPAVIFYTSGTTGRPKGAVSTHRSMIANLQNTIFNAVAGAMISGSAGTPVDGGRQNTALLTSPLFHVSGCHSGIVVAMAAGVKVVMTVGKFEAEQALALMEAEQVNVWATVPTMVWRVVEHPEAQRYDLSSVTTVGYGGSPSGGELQRRVRQSFPNVKTLGNAYGLTESSSVATINSGDDFLQRPDSVGRATPIVDIRIVRDDTEAAQTGEVGEIWLKGPQIMPGYWGKPDETARTVTEGWLHTGDIGYLDDEGYLYITDRAKDMIIRGGENVYCVEIENRLVEHPSVADAAVIGVAHPTLGEEVKAIVQVEPGAKLTEDEIKAWVAATLANFKVPTYVDIRTDRLPRNASGKLLKNLLRGKGDVSFAETL